MPSENGLFGLFSRLYESQREVEMSLEGYLKGCADDPAMLAGPAERMLIAIGEPQMVDTSLDSRIGRIFMNRTIKVYPAFADFFGMEETIERIVGFFRHAAQGLEERKQVLYLLGPVGGGKSSLAERLKLLMEKCPVYVLKAGNDISPVFESPLGLFDPNTMAEALEKRYSIPLRRLPGVMSPWAMKRLTEFGGDISKFSVVRMVPSRLRQICISKTEPGDENNQDVSSLVGKVDIRKLEFFSQNDPTPIPIRAGSTARPGHPRVRRDVQGADQDAPPVADGDAGEQLRRHREHRRHPVPGHHPRALQRVGVADFQETTRTTRPSSTASASSRCRTACASPRSAKSTRSCSRRASWRRRPAPRVRSRCWPASASSRA